MLNLLFLDEENWNDEDVENVLLCGRHDENITQFNPKYYIILNRTNGNHYELITWKGKGMLTFKEIPCILREEIVNKCLERNSGLFYMIPKFAKLKEEDEENIHKGRISLMGAYDDTVPFSENTIFQFYSKSSGKKAPGKGAGERISSNDLETQKYKKIGRND